MPFCFTTLQTWVRNIEIRDEYKQCTIQLRRRVGCFCEEYEIIVNGEAREPHGLSYNPCSPLCCSGGEYEWEQDGHIFLLVYNSLSFVSVIGKYRLFIDGIDVNTGREYSALWRRRGYQVMCCATVLFLIGVVLSVRVVLRPAHIQYMFIVACGLCVAVFIVGLIPVLRNRKPRYADRMPIEQTPNTF